MSSIYLVLDMMNDLIHADGPNGSPARTASAHACSSDR